jgi:hypothetical protein
MSTIQDQYLTLAKQGQDQYAALTRQGQDAATALAGAWTRSLQESSIKVPSAAGQAAALEVIDQAFDFAVKVLNVQRNLSKQLVTRSATAAEDVARQATTAANETTEKVVKVARRATRSA